MGILVWHIPPLIHPLRPNNAASLAVCMVCTTRSSSQSCQPPYPQGWVGMFCFPLIQSFGCFLCSLHWPGGHYRNYSQQCLSLLNEHWMSLMRKAVLQSRMALDIFTPLPGGIYTIIQTECCVFIPDGSLMYHFY